MRGALSPPMLRRVLVFQAGSDSTPTGLVNPSIEWLSDEVVGQADHVAHIPIQTDSLNAAMAATVALYELSRRMAPE